MWFKLPKFAITGGLAITGVIIAWKWSGTIHYTPREFVPPGDHAPSLIQVLKVRLRRIVLRTWTLVMRPNINQVSWLLEFNIDRLPDLRSVFVPLQVQFNSVPVKGNHSHPKSAANRSTANQLMNKLCQKAGFIGYNVSMAAGDSVGCRYFYFAKDVMRPYMNTPITSESVLIMTDVDYYADMPAWLSLLRPMLLYTFVPTSMAATRGEYSYRFVGDEVEFSVSGGATYKHPLWVYEGDTMTVDLPDGSLAVYSVEQRLIPDDPDHRYICLLPVAHIIGGYSDLMKKTAPLKRFVNEGFLYDAITDIVSYPAGGYHSVDLPARLVEAVQRRLFNKPTLPVVADVERMLRDAKVTDYTIKAALLFGSLSKDVPIRRNIVHTSSLAHYHPVVTGGLSTEDGKPMGEAVSPPMVYPGSSYPTKSEASDKATVAGRVEKPRNDVVPSRIYHAYANEFLTQLIRKPKRGIPWDVADVKNVQTRAEQRNRIKMVECSVTTDSPNKLRSFIKAESYTVPNDPRNITTMSPELTLMMSCFTYSFKKDVLKDQDFYAPGKTPEKILERLSEICRNPILATDYSRFDGSISAWLQQYIVRAAYLRWVDKNRYKELYSWFDKVFVDKAVTSHGVRYNPGWGTRSGSPITTDGNTMINAFVAFAALRKLGLSIKLAFESIGLCCGDDGVISVRPGLMEMMVQVSLDLGLKLEPVLQEAGPYDFCGRRFIDPTILPDSYQNLKRTLPKLHLVNNGADSVEQRIANKAHGYAVTDLNTPLLGDWVKTVMRLTGLGLKDPDHELAWKLSMPWPQFDLQRLRECVCDDLDISDAELQQMQRLINNAKSLDELPILFDGESEPKLTCVRDGLLIHSRVHVKQDGSEDKSTRKTSGKPETSDMCDDEPRRIGGSIRELGDENTQCSDDTSECSVKSAPTILRKDPQIARKRPRHRLRRRSRSSKSVDNSTNDGKT